MKKPISFLVTVGWVTVLSFPVWGQAISAGKPASTPQMTLFVYNRAQVEPGTLKKAYEVAARIFRNAGVEVTVVVDPPPAIQEETTEPKFPTPFSFFVQILAQEMVERLRLPSTVLGFAPGTPQERGRNKVYVFDHVASRIAREQAMARVSKILSLWADKGQVLGYGMAHEIGHVLLRLESHSESGIMQSHWDRDALADIAAGRLNFSSEESDRIRAELARRAMIR